MNIFVAFEGFTLPAGYVAKEVTVLFPNGEYNHYILKKPEFRHLSTLDEQTVRYVTRYINGISYVDGNVPYEELGAIIKNLEGYTIYTYSSVAKTLIQDFLPTTVVINIQELDHFLPTSLPNPRCFRNHPNYRYCSKAKAIAIKNIIENEQTR